MDNYISNTVNNEDKWSEFTSEDIKEKSQNVSSVENVEAESRNDMSGAKLLKDLQVLWILYYRNQTLLKMVIEF